MKVTIQWWLQLSETVKCLGILINTKPDSPKISPVGKFVTLIMCIYIIWNVNKLKEIKFSNLISNIYKINFINRGFGDSFRWTDNIADYMYIKKKLSSAYYMLDTMIISQWLKVVEQSVHLKSSLILRDNNTERGEWNREQDFFIKKMYHTESVMHSIWKKSGKLQSKWSLRYTLEEK